MRSFSLNTLKALLPGLPRKSFLLSVVLLSFLLENRNKNERVVDSNELQEVSRK